MLQAPGSCAPHRSSAWPLLSEIPRLLPLDHPRQRTIENIQSPRSTAPSVGAGCTLGVEDMHRSRRMLQRTALRAVTARLYSTADLHLSKPRSKSDSGFKSANQLARHRTHPAEAKPAAAREAHAQATSHARDQTPPSCTDLQQPPLLTDLENENVLKLSGTEFDCRQILVS